MKSLLLITTLIAGPAGADDGYCTYTYLTLPDGRITICQVCPLVTTCN